MNKIIGFENEFNSLLNHLKNDNLTNSLLLTGNKGIGKNLFLTNLIEEYIKIKINNDQINHHISLLYNNSHPNVRFANKEIDEKTKKIKNFITVDQVRRLNQFSLETSIIENLPKFILIDIDGKLKDEFMSIIIALGPLSSVVSILKRDSNDECLKNVFNNYTKKQIPSNLKIYS